MCCRRQIATSVIKFLEESDQKDITCLLHDPSWIWSIPLLHLLEGDVKAFQKPEEEFNCDSWWGIISFEEQKLDQIARKRRWKSYVLYYYVSKIQNDLETNYENC